MAIRHSLFFLGSMLLLLSCDPKYGPSADDSDDDPSDDTDDDAMDAGTIEDSGSDASDEDASEEPPDDAGTVEEDADAGAGEDPTCEILTPEEDESANYEENFMFSATASDSEDGPLSDESIVWTSDVSDEIGIGNMFVRALETPGEHTITCTVTDSAGQTGTDTVTIVVTSPIATITAPSNGATFDESELISFTGNGRDAEDGTLTGASLSWNSDLDGSVGNGTFVQSTLSAGTHIITLIAENVDGDVDVANVTITVTP